MTLQYANSALKGHEDIDPDAIVLTTYTVRWHGIDNRHESKSFMDSETASKLFSVKCEQPRIIRVELWNNYFREDGAMVDDELVDSWSDEEWNG